MAACPSTLTATPLHDIYQDQDDVFISDSDDGLLMLNNYDMDQFALNHEASYQPDQQPQSKKDDKEIQASDDNDSVLLSVVDDRHAANGGEDVAIVIDQQPRKSSDPDRSLFQPSQIEEKLLNDRLLAGTEGGAAQLSAQLAVAVRKKATTTTKTTGSSLAAANNESRSPRRRRASLWNGVVACLTPVMGYFKKEKQPKVKEDEWEIDFADISELNFIGSGAQGAVFAGIYLGEKVAVKKVKDPKYCQEAWNMRKLNHTNIVKMM